MQRPVQLARLRSDPAGESYAAAPVAASPRAKLVAEGISKRYGSVEVLHPTDLTIAAGVGKMSFADLGDDNAAAFGTNFEAAEIGGSAAQRLVSGVEAVLDPGGGGAVKAMGAQEQVEFSEGLYGAGEEGFNGTGSLAAHGAGIVRRRPLGAQMGARTIVKKSCGALYQKTAPISARPRGPRWMK